MEGHTDVAASPQFEATQDSNKITQEKNESAGNTGLPSFSLSAVALPLPVFQAPFELALSISRDFGSHAAARKQIGGISETDLNTSRK